MPATSEGGELRFPTHLVMQDLQKGTSTSLELTSWELDVPADQLPDELFDPASLDAR